MIFTLGELKIILDFLKFAQTNICTYSVLYILNQRLLEIKALVETRYVTKTHTHACGVCASND